MAEELTLEQRVEILEQWMAEATKPKLEVGMTLYGFCGGFFGRDDYDDKIITEIGPNYVVARPLQGGAPRTAHLGEWRPADLLEYTQPEPCYDCGGKHDDNDCPIYA